MDVRELLDQGLINRADYDCYVMFEVSEEGHNFFNKWFESICMEDPVEITSESTFAWQDGRRSVVRDIKKSILLVKGFLKTHQGD